MCEIVWVLVFSLWSLAKGQQPKTNTQKKVKKHLVSSPHVNGKYHPPLLVAVVSLTTIINISINYPKVKTADCFLQVFWLKKFSTGTCALDVHFGFLA
jgi:hypothetical protein